MLTLPYPTSPNNGDPLDASIVQANQQAITQAIQTFDASQIQAGTLAKDASFATALSPVTRLKETTSNFVQSGCTWSSVSGLQGTMAGGVVYINGLRVVVTGVVSYTFTASQDTYVDVDYNGNVYYVAVANGATTGMILTPNSVRVAKIVSSATALTIVQFGSDPIGNLIAPIGADSTAITQNPIKFSAYTSSAVPLSGTGAVPLNALTFDSGNNFSTSLNQFTAPFNGYYQFNGQIDIGNATAGSYYWVSILKNGGELVRGSRIQPGYSAAVSFNISVILQLVANDTIKLGYACQTAATTEPNNATFLQGFLVSRT